MEKLPNKIELNCDDGDVNGAESDNEKDIDSGDNKVTFYRFLEDHPLYYSHHVMLLQPFAEHKECG